MTTTKVDPWVGTDVIGRKVRSDLMVELTDGEVMHRGESLALQTRALIQLEQVQKNEMNALKRKHRADLNAACWERNRLSDAVNDRKEPRPVACFELADFNRGVVYTVRADTSETVSTRRLRPEEQQVKIAMPLRVVPDPQTGKLRRDDGRSLDTLPFVRPDQCAPQVCRKCEGRRGQLHSDDCDLKGLGRSAVVTEDNCDDQKCLECDAELGGRHAETCQFSN